MVIARNLQNGIAPCSALTLSVWVWELARFGLQSSLNLLHARSLNTKPEIQTESAEPGLQGFTGLHVGIGVAQGFSHRSK